MTVETRAHTFDGIQEFDNRLPNWWLWTFYLAIIYSVGYWIHYHTIGLGEHPTESYVVEMKAAAEAKAKWLEQNPVTDEALLDLAKNPQFVEEGKALFMDPTKCAQCHKPDGGGLVGPNLTDEFWIYGGKPTDIYESILNGRPGGMLAHKIFGLGFVQRTAAYVLSIKNTNVKGKPPEPNAKKEG
ncbi:MAG: cbb3-type cytochrome c oxidase N-terminal domain-containing protein [Planctomycetota bacterium]